ncbi:MAG: hypothetical protein H7257_10190 [Taibaiella sp.]|nr:hypothetical protein [Taibaiella sp.]
MSQNNTPCILTVRTDRLYHYPKGEGTTTAGPPQSRVNHGPGYIYIRYGNNNHQPSDTGPQTYDTAT